MQLKQIATVNAGYPFRGSIAEIANSDISAVQMKDVSLEHGIQWQTCISTSLTGKRKPDWLRAGDILVAARGNRNYAVEVDTNIPSSRRAVAAPHFFLIRITNKKLLPGYLTWFLNQVPCQQYFTQNAEGSLTKSIRRSVLEEAPIVIPSLTKQHTIVDLVKMLQQEKNIMQQLHDKNELLLTNIARDLLMNTKEY